MSSTVKIVQNTAKQVKPLLSKNHQESRRRVLHLYRAWRRQVPIMHAVMELSKTKEELYVKIREDFMKNKDVTDIRVIDMLVFKGEKKLEEVENLWAQPCHVLNNFNETIEPKPKKFLAKFFQSNYS